MPVNAASSASSCEQKKQRHYSGAWGRGDSLFDFPPSTSPTFISRQHTLHTPRLDFLTTPAFETPGGDRRLWINRPGEIRCEWLARRNCEREECTSCKACPHSGTMCGFSPRSLKLRLRGSRQTGHLASSSTTSRERGKLKRARDR